MTVAIPSIFVGQDADQDEPFAASRTCAAARRSRNRVQCREWRRDDGAAANVGGRTTYQSPTAGSDRAVERQRLVRVDGHAPLVRIVLLVARRSSLACVCCGSRARSRRRHVAPAPRAAGRGSRDRAGCRLALRLTWKLPR
jgi:hypothetical protein